MSQPNQPGAQNAEPVDDQQELDPLAETNEAENRDHELAHELSDLLAQLKEADNRTLRAQAELDNYRKRVRREMEEDRKYAALPVIRDLLQVVDNLDRALGAAGPSETQAGLLEGVKMVAAQLSGLLQQHHCQRIESVGEPFDPNRHEAIGQEPSTEFPPHTVTREMRAGYSMHDRIIRPAQVFISAGVPEADPS